MKNTFLFKFLTLAISLLLPLSLWGQQEQETDISRVMKKPYVLDNGYYSLLHEKQESKFLDKIIASVENKYIITETDLLQASVTIKKRLSKGIKINNKKLIDQALESLILKKVQLYEASRLNITISDKELEAAVQVLAKRHKMNPSDLKHLFEKKGERYESFLERQRENMTIKKLISREVTKKIDVSDKEITDFLEASSKENIYKFIKWEVVIPQEASTVQNELLRKAVQEAKRNLSKLRFSENILWNYKKIWSESWKKIEKDFNLSSTKKRSKSPYKIISSQVRKIELSKEELEKSEIQKNIKNLKINQSTPILRDKRKYYFYSLYEIDNRDINPLLKEYKVKSILLDINPFYNDQARKKHLDIIRKNILDKHISFPEAVRKYSKDYMTQYKNGDLGWQTINSLQALDSLYSEKKALGEDAEEDSLQKAIEEFEKRKESQTPITSLSTPLKTPQGWHIIEISKSRMKEASFNKVRTFAKDNLRKKKYKKAYDKWLKRIREEVFVQIH